MADTLIIPSIRRKVQWETASGNTEAELKADLNAKCETLFNAGFEIGEAKVIQKTGGAWVAFIPYNEVFNTLPDINPT